jgi:hypothetical protein
VTDAVTAAAVDHPFPISRKNRDSAISGPMKISERVIDQDQQYSMNKSHFCAFFFCVL